MTLATARLLVGRTIVAVDLRPFPDGRGRRAYQPVLTLDNGATVDFSVQETESLAYGVRPEYQTGTTAQARKATRARHAALQAVGAMLAGPVGEGDSIGLTGDELRAAQEILCGRLP